MRIPVVQDMVRRWRKAGPSVPPMRYEVVCACGQSSRGERREKHQVVNCVGCGRPLFILPCSRLPAVRNGDEQAQAAAAAEERRVVVRSRRQPWRLPLMVGLVVIASFTLIIGQPQRPAERSSPEAIPALILAGQKALALGKFRGALKEFEAAQKLRAQHPETLSLSARKQLNQLQRQAALLADLVPESIDDILRHASELTELDESEWQAQFAARYQGKGVVFDDVVRRGAVGSYQMLGYRFFVRGRPARAELGGLRLLRALPLDKPQRLLFGVRLSAVRVEGGVWVVHFQPDSGVLLTDAAGTAGCCPLPADELQAIIARQTAWVADLP